jgi:hypothetical protein
VTREEIEADKTLTSALAFVEMNGGGYLQELIEAGSETLGRDGRTDPQSSFYKRHSSALRKLSQAGHIQRAECIEDVDGDGVGRRVVWYGPLNAPLPATAIGEPGSQVQAESGHADEQPLPTEQALQRAPVYALNEVAADALQAAASSTVATINRQADEATEVMVERAREQLEQLPERIEATEAVRYVAMLDRQAGYHSDAELIARFKLGVVALKVGEAASHGDGALDTLAEATGVHINTVRECRRLVQKFELNVVKFGRWLAAGGVRKRWTNVQSLIGSNWDPTVLGAEAMWERQQRREERTAEAREEMAGVQKPEGLAEPLSDDARHLAQQGLTRLAEVKVAVDAGEAAPGHAIPRDPIFMQFVGRLPCLATGAVPPSEGWEPYTVANDPHHSGTGGTGIKGSDYTCVPLCRDAHNYLHQHGVRAFEQHYGVNLLAGMFQTVHLYLAECKADLPSALIQ